MPIRFAPKFLTKLARDPNTVLKNDADVQKEIAQMRVSMEREDNQRRGEIFSGPMIEDQGKQPLSLPFPELAMQDQPKGDGRLDEPMLPAPQTEAAPPKNPSPVPEANLTSPTPDSSLGGGYISPPNAPPPPPADRPPGLFVFPPDERRDREQDQEAQTRKDLPPLR